jgi:hypothetical protein
MSTGAAVVKSVRRKREPVTTSSCTSVVGSAAGGAVVAAGAGCAGLSCAAAGKAEAIAATPAKTVVCNKKLLRIILSTPGWWMGGISTPRSELSPQL